jgi:hypothetical protein
MITEQDILAFLDGLGATTRAIAATLKQRGIRGQRYSAFGCPLAIALRQHFALPELDIGVTPNRIRCWYTVEDWRISIPLSKAMAAFVWLFDWGHYPALESPSHPATADLSRNATPGENS